MVLPWGVIRKKMIIKAFLNVGAVSPSSAKTPKEAGVFLGLGLAFSKLLKVGILKKSVEDRYYIDKTKL